MHSHNSKICNPKININALELNNNVSKTFIQMK